MYKFYDPYESFFLISLAITKPYLPSFGICTDYAGESPLHCSLLPPPDYFFSLASLTIFFVSNFTRFCFACICWRSQILFHFFLLFIHSPTISLTAFFFFFFFFSPHPHWMCFLFAPFILYEGVFSPAIRLCKRKGVLRYNHYGGFLILNDLCSTSSR